MPEQDKPFHQLMAQHLLAGTCAEQETASIAPPEWNLLLLAGKLSVTDRTVRKWRSGESTPDNRALSEIVQVFFGDNPIHAEDKALFIAAWERADNARSKRDLKVRTPPDPVAITQQVAVSGDPGHDFGRFVEFILHPLQTKNEDPTKSEARATLRISPTTMPWRNGTVELTLRHAFLRIPVTGYQVCQGTLIGDVENQHDNFVRETGGSKIVGPLVGDCIHGDVLQGAHMAVIEPGPEGGGPLTVLILANRPCFDVTAAHGEDKPGFASKVLKNKQIVLKELVFDTLPKDIHGDAMLARRTTERRDMR